MYFYCFLLITKIVRGFLASTDEVRRLCMLTDGFDLACFAAQGPGSP